MAHGQGKARRKSRVARRQAGKPRKSKKPRNHKHHKKDKQRSRVLATYNHRCFFCHEPITKDTPWNTHHIVRKANQGPDNIKNLAPAHISCHDAHNKTYNL